MNINLAKTYIRINTKVIHRIITKKYCSEKIKNKIQEKPVKSRVKIELPKIK